MPRKRRMSKQHDGRITPQVVALYRRAVELRERAHLSDDDRHAAHAAERDVDRALGVKLWEYSIFNNYQHPGDADWEHALALRQKLDAALAQASTAPAPSPTEA